MAPEALTNALNSTNEIELTVTGRRSGRKTSRPVWFVRDDATLFLVPVTGSDSAWYKNLSKDPTITLSAKGVRWTAKASPLTDGARVSDIVDRFRAKYGAGEVKKYFAKLDVAVAVPLA